MFRIIAGISKFHISHINCNRLLIKKLLIYAKKKFKVTPSKPNDQLNYLPNSVGCDKIIDAAFSKEIQI